MTSIKYQINKQNDVIIDKRSGTVELVNKFREMLMKQKAYAYVLTVTGWDSNTEAPRGAFA